MTNLLHEVRKTSIATAVQRIFDAIGAIFIFLIWNENISDPFYHEGWWLDDKALVFIVVACFVFSVWLCLTGRGIWALASFVLAAIIFWAFYERDFCAFEICGVVAWLAHGIAAAVFFPVAGWLLALGLTALQGSRSHDVQQGCNRHNEH